jgi:uncharacterized damage-inducible protein DinB
MNSKEFAILYNREIGKLRNEVAGYNSDDDMWIVLPGTTNTGGNLVQHLIGNLRTYIGLTLGCVPYVRDRDAEFSKKSFTKETLLSELEVLQHFVETAISNLTDEDLQAEYPHEVFAMLPKQSVSIILAHVLNHLGYHMGQINYHRRFVSAK